MAAPTYTLATVTKNADGTYTLGNQPTGAYALATVDATSQKVPASNANFGGTSSAPSPGGPGGTARDPFAVGDVKSITDAVTAASNTWSDGDLTAYGSSSLQDAGAPPAVAGQNSTILVGSADVATMDEFDMKDSTGSAWRYRYSRRNDGASGWTRVPKG